MDAENPDGERLLRGESITSASADEAAHWASVYAELAQFLAGGFAGFRSSRGSPYRSIHRVGW